MNTVKVKVVAVSEDEAYIVKNYDKKSASEICEVLNLEMKDYRGLTAQLSIKKLILTPNRKKKIEADKRLAEAKALKNGNSFTNVHGVHKQIGRDIICTEIKDSGLVGTVLSLPFGTAPFELQLINEISKDFSFVGVEHNEHTYYDLLQTVVDNRIDMSCIKGEFIDTLRTSLKNQYAHIFADLCGNFSSYVDEIKIMLKNKLVQVGGTISITLAHRGKSDVLNLMNELNPIGLTDGNSVERGIITFLNKQAKSNYALVKSFTYKDDEQQAMILFVLKRIK